MLGLGKGLEPSKERETAGVPWTCATTKRATGWTP